MSLHIAFCTVVLIWGTTPLAISWSNDSVSPLLAISSRVYIATIILAVIIAVFRHKSGLKKQNIIVYGYASLSIFPNMIIVYWAAQYMPSSYISLTFAMTPFFTSLLASFLLPGNSLSQVKMVALLVAFAGLYVATENNDNTYEISSTAVIAMLGSAALFALSSVLVKRCKPTDSLEQTLGALVLSIPGFLIVSMITGMELPLEISKKSVLSILYLAIIGSVLGLIAFFFALARMSAITISLIPLMAPIIAVWLGVTINNEPHTFRLIIGTSIIILALAMHQNLGPILMKQLKRNIYNGKK